MNLVIAALLFSFGVLGHFVRLLILDESQYHPVQARVMIAVAAIVVYSTAGFLCLAGSLLGYWIAIVFPLVGVIAVMMTGNTIDRFQIGLGAFQLLAAILSLIELTR